MYSRTEIHSEETLVKWEARRNWVG